MKPSKHVQAHVETIVKHEQDFLARRTPSERLGDAIAGFVGSLLFVVLHVIFFSLWILANTVQIQSLRHFDPAPFSLLGTCVALEAILLASFILMRQARLARRADEREHLILQILLLTEKEITAVVQMSRQIASEVGLHTVAGDKDIEQLGQQTSIDDVARSIQDNLSTDQ